MALPRTPEAGLDGSVGRPVASRRAESERSRSRRTEIDGEPAAGTEADAHPREGSEEAGEHPSQVAGEVGAPAPVTKLQNDSADDGKNLQNDSADDGKNVENDSDAKNGENDSAANNVSAAKNDSLDSDSEGRDGARFLLHFAVPLVGAVALGALVSSYGSVHLRSPTDIAAQDARLVAGSSTSATSGWTSVAAASPFASTAELPPVAVPDSRVVIDQNSLPQTVLFPRGVTSVSVPLTSPFPSAYELPGTIFKK